MPILYGHMSYTNHARLINIDVSIGVDASTYQKLIRTLGAIGLPQLGKASKLHSIIAVQ